MAFPPLSDRDRVPLTGPVRLDPGSVERLQQSAWFLYPDEDAVRDIVTWTFEVATMRAHRLPRVELVDTWLLTIADREIRRLRARGDRPIRPIGPAQVDPGQLNHRLAEAVERLEPDARLALVLRYRLGQPVATIGLATGHEAATAARVVRRAALRVARRVGAPASSLAGLGAPTTSDLPVEVIPLDRQPGRHRLDYGWRESGFPTDTVHDHRKRRWFTVSMVAAAIVAAAMVGLGTRPADNRPRLVDEPDPTVTTSLGEVSSAPLPSAVLVHALT